jgi:hypothetical protein
MSSSSIFVGSELRDVDLTTKKSGAQECFAYARLQEYLKLVDQCIMRDDWHISCS